MRARMATYRCAVCQRSVEYAGDLPALFPFCSPRCKLVDLGKWLREQYTIDRDVAPEDAPPAQPPTPPRDADF